MTRLDRLARARSELMALVLAVPDDVAEEPVCGEWNLRCVLAHLSGWDTYFTAAARLLRAGAEVPFRGDSIDEWNRQMVTERESKSWDEVREEFVRMGEHLLEEYGRLDEGQWGQRFWPGIGATPEWAIRRVAEHYEEHLAGIKERLGGQPGGGIKSGGTGMNLSEGDYNG
ncbi:MAG TPA: DinB family protein [Chloroflexota bacterium]|nr:DinB family protein [Chloroflexota bacterium]